MAPQVARFVLAASSVVLAMSSFVTTAFGQDTREHLTHARTLRVVVIPEATHFVHLDRPERGRSRVLEEVLAFLDERD